MIILILILIFASFFFCVSFSEIKIKNLNLARFKFATKDIINELILQINKSVYEKSIYPLIKKLSPVFGKNS